MIVRVCTDASIVFTDALFKKQSHFLLYRIGIEVL